jgi:hypothetical protein
MAKIVSIKNRWLERFLGHISAVDGEIEEFESERSDLIKVLLRTKDDAEIERLRESIAKLTDYINAHQQLKIELVRIVHDIDKDYKI